MVHTSGFGGLYLDGNITDYFVRFAAVTRVAPVIAIDGPSASGKGTVAARVAGAAEVLAAASNCFAMPFVLLIAVGGEASQCKVKALTGA